MSPQRRIVRMANSFVSLVVLLALLTSGVYAAYALWDNNQVYEAARDVQLQMKELKPELTEDGPTFDELLAVNPDVCAWLTLDGTEIDFPVVQGETNLTYINTDVYGNFALAGSIFLDCRNAKDFSDPYNLLYGHHMAESNMFGNLDLYADETFFRENTTGILMTPTEVYDLTVVAYLVVGASTDGVFAVEENRQALDQFVDYVNQNATYISASMPQPGDNVRLLAMSTCSSDFTDARTVLITTMNPRNET